MASVTNQLDLGDGCWEVRVTQHATGGYAHLEFCPTSIVWRPLTLNALSEPEVMDLLEACRVALEMLRAQARGPE